MDSLTKVAMVVNVVVTVQSYMMLHSMQADRMLAVLLLYSGADCTGWRLPCDITSSEMQHLWLSDFQACPY